MTVTRAKSAAEVLAERRALVGAQFVAEAVAALECAFAHGPAAAA